MINENRVIAVVCSITLSLGLGLVCASSAQAQPLGSTTSAKVDQLIQLYPGSSRQGILDSAKQESKRSGNSLNHVLDEGIKEGEEHSIELGTASSPFMVLSSSGAPNKSLPTASHRGDIFWSPNKPAHHVGIYAQTRVIVQAPGPNRLSEKVPLNKVKVFSGAQLMYVKTSQRIRNLAADQSYHYVGRKYGFNPFNKTDTGSLNCSQLVYLSYKIGTGIDLDNMNDAIIWPDDIRDSSRTQTYRVIR